MRTAGILLLLACGLAQAAGKLSAKNEVYLAPGWGTLGFEAPAAGSYQLPVVESAHGGSLLDISGKSVELNRLLGDKPTLLSFVYRTCDDVNGCPLSTMVLYKVASRIEQEAELADKVRLLTVSFDPEFDTPEVMREYGESIMGSGRFDWHFLTSASDSAIKPVLDAYQQSVVADKTTSGERNKFSHILRVYLIDRQRNIRNIYSVSFLHPDILINDVKTLLMEDQQFGVNEAH